MLLVLQKSSFHIIPRRGQKRELDFLPGFLKFIGGNLLLVRKGTQVGASLQKEKFITWDIFKIDNRESEYVTGIYYTLLRLKEGLEIIEI